GKVGQGPLRVCRFRSTHLPNRASAKWTIASPTMLALAGAGRPDRATHMVRRAMPLRKCCWLADCDEPFAILMCDCMGLSRVCKRVRRDVCPLLLSGGHHGRTCPLVTRDLTGCSSPFHSGKRTDGCKSDRTNERKNLSWRVGKPRTGAL